MATLLEDVFKINGVPTYTFVEPNEYGQLLLNLRTPGRGLVIEGPSGIGKTTAVETAIHKLKLGHQILKLSARKPDDVAYIEALPEFKDAGTIIDDFHKLNQTTRSMIADYLKILADEESRTTKLIILGINRAGENLIHFASDLVNRLDIIRFDSNPDRKVRELIKKGEAALHVEFGVTEELTKAAQGSFYLAQMLSREICLAANVLETPEVDKFIELSFEAVRAKVWDRLGNSFRKRCEEFCRGSRFKKEGRAPYLHILHWLGMCDDWTLDLRSAIRQNITMQGSVSQVLDKGFLRDLINQNGELREVLHFDESSEQLTIDDPQFLFYVRNIPWRKFARELGFLSYQFTRRYDFALSFAGADREIAQLLSDRLLENELAVFYDKYEQHRILAEDIEEYLSPIYQSEARFVIALLSQNYPKRIWTKFESDMFRQRFKDSDVIPIWFSDVPTSMFDESRKKGGIEFKVDENRDEQVNLIGELLVKKLGETRHENADEPV
jgi:TIR domain